MKKTIILLTAVLILSACATFNEVYHGHDEERYKAKVEEYKKTSPEGYLFNVDEKTPYELISFLYKTIQVIDKNEILACQIKGTGYSEWEAKSCAGNTEHIKFNGETKPLVDDELFRFVYYKNNEAFSYTNVAGAKATIRSRTVIMKK